MGAYIRHRERSIEKRLAANATKGVQAPAVPSWGVPNSGVDPFEDRRAAIPPLGLREYWYPLAPDRRVPRRKPLYWNMLGDELVLFRDKEGGVRAATDVCPHRGASMAQGKCFYKGTITCPYHGATFDPSGECVAYLTEGPDSRMVNNAHVRIRTYPTVTLKGFVFVWMGDSEPVDPKEDLPPELFLLDNVVILPDYTYWENSWMIAIENAYDSHNQGFFVHRNSLTQLVSGRSQARVPHGTRSKLVDDVALYAWRENANYYADESGNVPFQLYYPGVDGKWPKTRIRKWIGTAFSPWRRLVNNKIRRRWIDTLVKEVPESWRAGHRLPGMWRSGSGHGTRTRWPVAVEPGLSRVVFLHSRRVNNPISKAWTIFWFHAFFKWERDYNFSSQDNAAAAPCRYWTPEHLSSCDAHLVLLRRLVLERSRDAKLGKLRSPEIVTPAEQLSYEMQASFGFQAEDGFSVVGDAQPLQTSNP